MRTLLRGLGALIGLAAALVGLPMLLLWIPQGSLAQLLPHTSELPDLILGNPLDPGVILLALVVVGWICWAQLLVSFIIEVVYEVRGVQVPHLGRFMPQTSVARAVSAIAVMVATIVPTTPSHAAPPPAAAAAAATGNEASADVLRVSPASHSAASHRYRTYEVRDGDCLWDIADHQLGDPERWPDIYKASTKLIQPGGQRLTDPDVLLPGWRLNIPVMEAKHPSKTPAKAPQPEATKAEPSSTSQQPQPEAQPTPDRTPDREPAMAGSPLRLGGGDSALPTTPAHLTGQPSRPVTPFQQPATDQPPEHTTMRPSTGLQTLPDWLQRKGAEFRMTASRKPPSPSRSGQVSEDQLAEAFLGEIRALGMSLPREAAVQTIHVLLLEGKTPTLESVRALAREMVADREAERPGTDLYSDSDTTSLEIPVVGAFVQALGIAGSVIIEGDPVVDSQRRHALGHLAAYGHRLQNPSHNGRIEVPRSLLHRTSHTLRLLAEKVEEGAELEQHDLQLRTGLVASFRKDADLAAKLADVSKP